MTKSNRILLDSEDALDLLTGLAVVSRVTGAMIHDARIAACCKSHGVKELSNTPFSPSTHRSFRAFSALGEKANS